MQYALVSDVRLEAFPGGRGICELCRAATVSKCGPRVMHHWAHAVRKGCDPWWENETEWHRAWKSRFPEECRERCYTAPDGEVHRADIVTPTGIVIETQHSAMSDEERISRERFYRNLVWIVDGTPFNENFDCYHLLPHPKSAVAEDIVWVKATRPLKGAARGLFFRVSEMRKEYPDATKVNVRGGWYHSMHEIETLVNESYCGHQQYDWVRPRRTWLDATCPVYIDFGDDSLLRLDTYDESGMLCVFRISKLKFIHDVMTETSNVAVGTRFYPLPSH